MTDFELIVLGFFMGVFFSMIMIMAGVIYDTRINRGERKGDSDMRIYIPKRSRNRCGDNGCNQRVATEAEKKKEGERTELCVAVLQTMIHSTRYCQREHEALAFAIDFMEKYGDYE